MNTPWKQQAVGGTQAAARDEGLRRYMLNIYNYMAGGLALTGIVALLFANNEALFSLLFSTDSQGNVGMSPLAWIAMLAPLGFVLFMSFRIQQMSFQTAQLSFWAYAAINGISFSLIFMAYTGESIARVFLITAGVFGAMSLYGYTTKRDLTGWGSFLIMGLFGLLIASLVNIFLQSTMLHFALSILGVGVFVGLTAYDTQKLKGLYYATAGTGELAAKLAIMGALNLYLDFINLFIYLLRLMGDRR